VKTAGFLY